MGCTGTTPASRAEASPQAEIALAEDRAAITLMLTLRNGGTVPSQFVLTANAYGAATPIPHDVAPGAELLLQLPLAASGGWYDFSVTVPASPGWSRRIAGRLETGKASISDPAMHGPAVATQWVARARAEPAL